MALTFVYGNSGSGKSEYIYRKTADMAEHAPYQHYFFVVPEQFTMSAQRKLVDHSSSGVIMNIDVVSFERLAWRVFDELGVHRTVMEETGKSLVLRRIAEQNEPKLTILKRSLKKMGYIGELKSVISELMQYGISPDDLENFLSGLPAESSLTYKLEDILTIYRSFDDFLKGGYVTTERVTGLLTEVAAESSLIKDAVFFFDGYTGFTPVQMDLMRELMHLASDIYVTVTLDTAEPLYAPAQAEDLFYMSRKMINSLTKAAAEASFGIADPVRIDPGRQSRFHDDPVLSHLERNIFRIPGAAYAETVGDHLKIASLLSPREEMRFAAAGILTLVREKGLRFRDCAIECSDVELYGRYADEIFELYGIPGFIDRKQSIRYHPLTELIRSVPEIADTDYSEESVFRFLRTGLAGFEDEEVDGLENYCIEKGIKGARKWNKNFESLPAGHGRLKYDKEKAAEELAGLNGLRQRFWELTEEAVKVFKKKDATVRERTGALYDMLCRLDSQEKLRRQTERFEEDGEEVAASLNRQIYKIVIDLLDKTVDLLGDEVLPASEYSEILEAGFDSARVGTIPPGNDCVILGDIERTRLGEIRALFLLGANDGQIPKKSSRQSILSEHDRQVIKDHDMELAPGEREQMFLQRFYLYLALTRPSDSLCVTFSRMDSEGAAIRPSYLVSALEKMFGGLKTSETASGDLLPLVTPKSSVESWITGLAASDKGVVTPLWKALSRWYDEHPGWKERISRLFDIHFSVYVKKNLSREAVRALYGEELINSFTRLERFGDCPYGHFLDYGLKLAEREEFAFTSLDMGTLFHSAIQKYCDALEKSGGWEGVTPETEDGIVLDAVRDAAAETCDPALFESASGAYDLERVYRIMKRSAWAVTEQIRRGDFRPAGYEISIDSPITDGDGNSLPARIVGRVDRMDICEEEDQVSARVVDYKSSGKELKLINVYYGRQLQLPVYLGTALKYLRKEYPGREIVPGGIFYFHMDDPMLSEPAEDEEESQKKLLGEMKPDGLLNSDPSVALKMDRDLAETGKSDILPVSLTKSGDLNQNSKSIISSEGFTDLMDYVRLILEESSRQMAEGNIEVSPYRMKDLTGCRYCSFGGICGFDPKVPGYLWREEEEAPNAEALEMMREKLGR